MSLDGYDVLRWPAASVGPPSPPGTVAALRAPPLRCSNRIFGCLPDADWQRWSAKLEFVAMPRGLVLQEPDRPRTHVWFPTTSVVSLLYGLEDGSASQVAVVGREGLVGIALVLGGMTHPSRAVVHAGGHGYRMRAADIEPEFRELSVLQVLMRYSLALMVQIAQNALCNRHHQLEQQVCRWLVSHLDRRAGDELEITHEQLAQLLGFRREGVSQVAASLQAAGAISYSRGRIRVLDRARLEARCCACHAAIEREYGRLMSVAD